MSTARSFQTTVVLAIAFTSSAVLAKTQKTSDDQTPKIPRVKVRVKVLDPDGEPVEGAQVTPSGLRSRSEPGSHWTWMEKSHGPLPKVRTNAEGIAELSYPKFVTEKLETGQVTWLVDHVDYVVFNGDRSVDEELAEIKLKGGYRIATTAINSESKAAIKTDLYAAMGGDWGSQWKVRKGGILTSRVFDRTQAAMRVIHLPADGPALFSDLQMIVPEEGQNRVFLRDVELKPGTVVAGMLDKSVPRPVTNGKVILVVVVPGLPSPDADSWNGRGPSWNWSSSAKVKADGSFRFDSLPRGDVSQMIAVCDGWVSKLPDGPKLKKKFPDLVTRDISPGMRWPQLFKLAGEKIEPTIAMEPTVNCEVLVQDPDGNPLSDAQVMMWPNQIFFAWGSQVLGQQTDFAMMLRKAREGVDLREMFLKNRKIDYEVTTDKNGLAVISNLPAPGTQGVAVLHKRFEQAIQGRDRQTTVELEQGKIAKVTVKLQPKGTETIGAGD